jgi:sulfate adenylyltransferase
MTPDNLKTDKGSLIAPYGGQLINLVVDEHEADELREYSNTLPALQLSTRSVCDLELLATGAFSPLDRFMSEADYMSVVESMRLADGRIFPIPVTLPIRREPNVNVGEDVVLRDARHTPLAVMRVEEIFEWDRRTFMRDVLRTESIRHPLVTEMSDWGDRNVSGRLRVIDLPRYYDFPELRLSPQGVRDRLVTLDNPNVVAFQTRNPLHRAHEEMTKRATEMTGGVLLMHPVVGLTKPGDIDHYSRVRAYKALTDRYYDRGRVVLALLPLAMRFAGPREALWHALIRRNYGANHFIVGRDHASPGGDENGRPFYGPDEARQLVEKFSEETGVRAVSFDELVLLPDTGIYEERSRVKGDVQIRSLSGTAVRDEYLDRGLPLPSWFTRPEIGQILQETFPPRHQQGVCIWFTGLSGAGKSTTAEILTAMLPSFGRRVTLLDGDVVRTNLSAGLAFDKAGRDANVRRIGFVASEIVRHGGVAVCAAISPYRETRNEVRKMVGPNFVEVFVSTPLDVCELRDPKGMYRKARRGELKSFTGIDDVYEEPLNAEITIGTVDQTAYENARSIVSFLIDKGLVREQEERPDDDV